jgi:chitodextrinase
MVPVSAATPTALAAVTIGAAAMLVAAGAGGGAPPDWKNDLSPPTAPSAIHATEVTASAVRIVWEPSVDDLELAGYELYGDLKSARSRDPEYLIRGATCGGTIVVKIQAVDRAGNRSPTAEATIATSSCPDVRPPSTPTGFHQVATSREAITLAWEPSSDDVGVVRYDLFREGLFVMSASGPSATLAGLGCGSAYDVGVEAVDGAGNRSARGAARVQTASCPTPQPPPPPADTTPPTSPGSLAVTETTTTTLSFTWRASSDDVGVKGYGLYRDGTLVSTTSQLSAAVAALTCGTSYVLSVDAFDDAGNRSARTELRASTAQCPQPPPPPGTTCGVDPATMTAAGCTVLRSDTSTQTDPRPGLWGTVECGTTWPNQDMSRHQLRASGGDFRVMANGAGQGNSSYRELTVRDGDDYGGERCELGRNAYASGENTGTQTSGTFGLYREGQRKITFFSMRFGAGFTSGANAWQTVMQMKQAQSYGANGPVNGAPALEMQVWGNRIRLHSFWSEKWSAPAPANGIWFRVATDVTYSQDPTTGRVRVYVDRNGDGDFLDSEEVSPVLTIRTLAYVTQQGSGSIPVAGSLPSHLRLGVYHDASAYGTTSVDVDNVQIVG